MAADGRKWVLVTGGCGYIGSHTVLELLQTGLYEVAVVDNLSNSSDRSLERVKLLSPGREIEFHQADICDKEALDKIFATHQFECVIHFAALKAVGESNAIPLKYYENNVGGTFSLLNAMKKAGCHNIIFSSSATVYGDPHQVPISEDFPLKPTNPYGRTKYFIEEMLKDFVAAERDFRAVILRYFNPVGAHPSGLIGESPNGIPNNLLPYICQVAVGRREHLSVYGDDWGTEPDGTGVRDYIHVVDLAKGHVASLGKIFGDRKAVRWEVYNLGCGKGYSVLQMLSALGKACGRELPYQVIGRRQGDIGACFADASKAKIELGWETTFGVEDMCTDAWRWQSLNPNGFEDDQGLDAWKKAQD
jgi:UDP-glucose 4-epimerase